MATDFQTGGQSTVCSAAEGHHLLDLATRGNEQSRQGGKVARWGDMDQRELWTDRLV